MARQSYFWTAKLSVELVNESDYIHHRNEVAALTDQRMIFIKIVRSYFAIKIFPLARAQRR